MADIYEDARLYDALGVQQFGGSDLAYWQRQCARYGGPALELACGSGRLTIPLAEEGVDIEGLDLSPAMLALAREKSDRGACICSGIWVTPPISRWTGGFRSIFLPNNSLAHLLTWRDLVSCLSLRPAASQERWAVRAGLLQPVARPADARPRTPASPSRPSPTRTRASRWS